MSLHKKTCRRGAVLVLVALVTSSLMCFAENIDPDDTNDQFAWAENAGWIDAEPPGPGNLGIQVEDFRLTGYAWGENIGWVSLSCANDSTCGDVNYNVTNNCAGALSGMAWAENIGWILFDPAGPEGVTIDTVTGEFSGFAWGENVGWLSFNCSNTGSCGTSGYRVTSSWTPSSVSPSGLVRNLKVDRSGTDLVLNWDALPGTDAAGYDVVRGTLGSLINNGGDFSVATDACLASDEVGTSLVVADGLPDPGDGFWYIIRGTNCAGSGSYGTSTENARDAGISASAADCP